MKTMALIAGLGILFFQWRYLSTTSRELNSALQMPLVKAGSLGIIIANPSVPGEGVAAGNPYLWGGANYFRASQAILTNAPWTDAQIIMIQPIHHYPWTYADPDQAPLDLVSDPQTARTNINFALRTGPSGRATEQATEKLAMRQNSPGPELTLYSRP